MRRLNEKENKELRELLEWRREEEKKLIADFEERNKEKIARLKELWDIRDMIIPS